MAQMIGKYVNPVLNALKQLGGSGQPAEVCAAVAKELKLEGSPTLEETLKNGVSKFENKIAWVRQNLVMAGYIDRSKRGVWSLTEKGRNAKTLSDIEINQLLLDIQRRGKKAAKPEGDRGEDEEEQLIPEESDYKARLFEIIGKLPPTGFEELCQFLLRENGFENVIVTGRSGDGGIDGHGLLRINPFVAFKVVFQCKRYVGTVSASVVRDFRGAMQGRADNGMIITTGTFSADAVKESVRVSPPQLELVNGEQLVELIGKLEQVLVPWTTYRAL